MCVSLGITAFCQYPLPYARGARAAFNVGAVGREPELAHQHQPMPRGANVLYVSRVILH